MTGAVAAAPGAFGAGAGTPRAFPLGMSVRAVRRIASDKTDDEVEAYLLAPPQIGCSMILLLPRPDRSLGEVVTTPVVRIFTGDDGGAWVQTGNSVYFVEPPADAADAAA